MRSISSLLMRAVMPAALAMSTLAAPQASAESVLHVAIWPNNCYSATGHAHFGIHIHPAGPPSFVAALNGVGEQTYLVGQNPYFGVGTASGNPAQPTVPCGIASPMFGSVVYTLGYVGINASSGTFHVACVTILSTLFCTPEETESNPKQSQESMTDELAAELRAAGIDDAAAAAALTRLQPWLVRAGVPA